MEQELVPQNKDERELQLEACEARIQEAFRMGLEAIRRCAQELITIESEQLYELRGYNSFKAYVENELRLDMHSAKLYMDQYRTQLALENAKLAMPLNESQVGALAKLSPDRAPVVWARILRVCDKADEPVTVSRIRKAVELDESEPEQPAAAPPKAPSGAKTSLTLSPELTEEGEKALARIRRICGEEVAEAIESGTIQLPERAITKWAEQTDLLMKNLIHYVIDLGWRVTDAISYEAKTITGSTTIDTIIVLAQARGGRVAIQHNEFRILVERMAADAA